MKLEEIIKICDSEKNRVFTDIKNICKRQLFAEKINKKFGFKLNYADIVDTNWYNIPRRHGENMFIAIYGDNYNRTILNIEKQPQNEWLFSMEFPYGAYLFGGDYPKELFNRFYNELETYKPKYEDKINRALYFDLDEGAKFYKDYEAIFEKYQKEYEKEREKEEKYE